MKRFALNNSDEFRKARRRAAGRRYRERRKFTAAVQKYENAFRKYQSDPKRFPKPVPPDGTLIPFFEDLAA